MEDTRGGKNDSFISFLPSLCQAKKTGGGGEVERRRPPSFCRPDLTGSQHPRIISLLLSFVRWRPACLDGARKQQFLCRHGTVIRGSRGPSPLCGGETCSLSRPRKGSGSLHYLLLRWMARTGLFICSSAPSSRPFVPLATGSHDLFIIYLKSQGCEFHEKGLMCSDFAVYIIYMERVNYFEY